MTQVLQSIGYNIFLINMKYRLLGVLSEAKSKQANLLIDEADTTGKGTNTMFIIFWKYTV